MKRQALQVIRMGLLLVLASFVYFSSCSKDEAVQPVAAEPDSSSHDFTWEEITIGDDHSYLHDVYALNDTDVWAVGKITTRDTLQPWKSLIGHNALHWDGRSWEIVDVPIPLPGTNQKYASELNSVFAFHHNDVWFGSGQVTFWDGEKYWTDETIYGHFPLGVYKIWGRRRDDVWLVGGKGALAHYDGNRRKFQVLQSGIAYDFNDVWGCGDTALCIASNWLWENSHSYVYRLVNGTAEQAYMKYLPRGMTSIWFCPGMRKLTAGGSFYVEWNGVEWKGQVNPPLRFGQIGIRGASPVDFFVVDQASGVAHYNGKSWVKHVVGNEGDNLFHALSCTRDQVWFVGSNQLGRTIIIHGKRNR